MDVIGGAGRRLAIVGGVLMVGAIFGGAYAMGLIGMPSVTGVDNRFAGVDAETTTVETDVGVRTPTIFAVGLGGVSVDYAVELSGVRLAEGGKEGVDLSTGYATLGSRTELSNEQIPRWWTAHVRDGETSDLLVHATIHSSTLDRSVSLTPVCREVSTDLLSAFDSTETRPANASQPLVSVPVLYVNETSAQWGSVTVVVTSIETTFEVHAPKDVPYAATAFGHEITLNGVDVGSGECERAYAIPPKSTRPVRATTAIDDAALDEWWVSHLERNQVTDLRIDFYARIELPTGNEVRVPLDALTYTETVETDVFGNEDETGGPGTPGGSTASASPTPTETDAGLLG